MTDLSRIDFSKCELQLDPSYQQAFKVFWRPDIGLQGAVTITSGHVNGYAAIKENVINGSWVICTCVDRVSIRRVELVISQTRIVDAFIATELAKPRRRKITGEQAAIALLQGKTVWRCSVGTVSQPDHRGERSIPGDVLSWSDAEIDIPDVVSGADGGTWSPNATASIGGCVIIGY